MFFFIQNYFFNWRFKPGHVRDSIIDMTIKVYEMTIIQYRGIVMVELLSFISHLVKLLSPCHCHHQERDYHAGSDSAPGLEGVWWQPLNIGSRVRGSIREVWRSCQAIFWEHTVARISLKNALHDFQFHKLKCGLLLMPSYTGKYPCLLKF